MVWTMGALVCADDFFDFGRRVGVWAEKTSSETESSECPERPRRPELDVEVFGEKTVLVFDTETASLHTPAVVQLAYALVEDGVVQTYSKILQRPRGVRMDQKSVEIHGISAEASDAGACPLAELQSFHSLATRVVGRGGVVVAHNARFDANAFNFTCTKLHSSVRLDPGRLFCTMRETKFLCNLRNKRGHRKPFFNNEELFSFLRGAPPTWARLHDAEDDVWVTLLSYERLLHRGFA
jgi:DNA polymerase III epsilon subunit-like protein